jgi:hypothetical protein
MLVPENAADLDDAENEHQRQRDDENELDDRIAALAAQQPAKEVKTKFLTHRAITGTEQDIP